MDTSNETDMSSFRKVLPDDFQSLTQYFENLSKQTRTYFAPHPFDQDTVSSIVEGRLEGFHGFICTISGQVVAYAVAKRGYSEGEWYRFPNYPIEMNAQRHYLFAPSVSDDFQSQGLGSGLLLFVEEELRHQGAQLLELWGGVQEDNQQAVRYYLKNGFRKLGEFYHEGVNNFDMAKDLSNADGMG
ncbi:MAG: GNAT family N-acetyltransferase [Bacteroidota bacterium]